MQKRQLHGRQQILKGKTSSHVKIHKQRKATGGVHVAGTKRIAVTLPDHLLQEFDDLRPEGKSRSELLRDAIRNYIAEVKLRRDEDVLAKGYLEMAEINVALAESGLTADYESLVNYETRLAECE